MSYSASDLADHVTRALVTLGYTISPVEEGADGDAEHYWDLGSNGIGSVNCPANAACADALDDLVNRIRDLQVAAGRVLALAPHGEMDLALGSLKESLDASIPGEIDEFIASIQASGVQQPPEAQACYVRDGRRPSL